MEELKTRSFRVSEEVSSKLKAVCADFDNQNAALDALIRAYEVQMAKAVIVDRKTELADLDTHLQSLQSAFLRSLELNENAEQRIRAEFRSLLDSKDEIIIQLQSDNAQLQEQAGQAETAYSDLKQATDERIEAMKVEVAEKEKNAQNAAERTAEAIKAREQAERIATMSTEQVEQLKTRVSELTAKANKSDEYKADKERLEASEAVCKARIGELEKKLVEEQEKAAAAMAAAAEMAAQDKASAVKVAIAETKEIYQEKIEQMQEKQAQQLSLLLQKMGDRK